MPARTQRKRRKPTARGEATRAAIVAAAIAAFAKRGFEAASTREIAEAAGIEQGLLTYHFPSKDALWRAAAERIFATLRESAAKRLASPGAGDPKERSREAIREYVRTIAAHPEFFRFIIDQGHRTDPRTRWLVDTQIRPAFEAVRGVVLHDAAPDEATLPHAFFALIGAASMIFAVPQNCRRLTGVDPRKRDAIEAHADFVANLMIPPRA